MRSVKACSKVPLISINISAIILLSILMLTVK